MDEVDKVQYQMKESRLGEHEHHQREYTQRPTAAAPTPARTTASTAAAVNTTSERAIKPLRKGHKNQGRKRTPPYPINALFSPPSPDILAWLSDQVVELPFLWLMQFSPHLRDEFKRLVSQLRYRESKNRLQNKTQKPACTSGMNSLRS